MGDVVAESLGVDCVAERQQARELGEGVIVEAVEVGEVARLVDLVNVGFLGGEGDVFANLVADGAQEGVVDEAVDDGVLVGARFSVLLRVGVVDLLVKETLAESRLCDVGRESCAWSERKFGVSDDIGARKKKLKLLLGWLTRLGLLLGRSLIVNS